MYCGKSFATCSMSFVVDVVYHKLHGGGPLFMTRIGRRTISCMFLIVALAVVWNLFGRRAVALARG
jgi:hypothetical protein